MRAFVGIDLGREPVPDETTVCKFRHRLEQHGLGRALFEEVTFDQSKVTSNDWTKYRIPAMGDVPEVKTVFISHNDRGINGGGEAANTVSANAIAAAFFDAALRFVTTTAGWLMGSLANVFVLFCLFLTVTPYGSVRLGGPDARPASASAPAPRNVRRVWCAGAVT